MRILNKVFGSIVKHFVSLSHFNDSFDPTEFNLGKDLNPTQLKSFWGHCLEPLFFFINLKDMGIPTTMYLVNFRLWEWAKNRLGKNSQVIMLPTATF